MTDFLKRLLESRFRISSQLYMSIGGAVMLTMGASLVGWFSFDRVGDAQSRVNEGSVPGMAAAFGVAQQSGALVAAAPRVASAVSPEAFALVTAEIAKERDTFEAQLAALAQQSGDEERFSRIRAHANTLISNIAAIEQSVAERFVLIERSEALRAELAEVRDVLVGALVPVIDDQLFYAMTGYRSLGEVPAPREKHFSEAEFDRYRHLSELQSDVTIAIQLLASAFNLSDAPLISPLRERFEAAKGRIERSLSALETVPSRDQVAQICAQLFKLGLGEQSGFDLRARELELVAHQRELLAMNNRLAIDLIADIEGLVSEARVSVQEATQASTQTISTGRRFLLALNIISIAGAVLIAYLFVGRVLLRRLERLSDRMRGMADGDLEAKVDIDGRDEVADMAAALEVFRRHALEVQRLNLVEKLAEELQDKNAELENVLADLQRAQDQIVMREKLAALGELTAGVAHEIKNPLNFVKNFAEVSAELIEELGEILEETGEGHQRRSARMDRRNLPRPHGQPRAHPRTRHPRGPHRSRHAHDGAWRGRITAHQHQQPARRTRPPRLSQRARGGSEFQFDYRVESRSKRGRDRYRPARHGPRLPQHGEQCLLRHRREAARIDRLGQGRLHADPVAFHAARR